MVKVVNQVFGKMDTGDRAYGCACVCNKNEGNYSQGNDWVWIPGGRECGCACNVSDKNYESNKSLAKKRA